MDSRRQLLCRVPPRSVVVQGGQRPGCSGWRAAMLGMLFLWLPLCFAADVAQAKTNPARIEAAFLRNFARYVSWPTQAFSDDQAPWRICVSGGDPFGGTLEETLTGRVEQGRPFIVVRPNTSADIRSCHVVFVAHRGSESRRAVLAELANRPILTVSDAPEFLQEGGVIRFQVSDHVEFSVNLDQANSASLKIPTKVLEVANEIVENGVARTRR